MNEHTRDSSPTPRRTSVLGVSGESAELRDGTRVFIRPVDPHDRRELADAFDHLSPESRYQRFLSLGTDLDARTLRYLTEVDHHDHEALAAFDGVDGHGVGIARYVRSPAESDTAELAVLVADDWQGRGLGTLLVERVLERARAEGVRRMTALVLGTNHVMLQLLKQHGWTVSGPPHDGTVEMTLAELAPRSRPPSEGTRP